MSLLTLPLMYLQNLKRGSFWLLILFFTCCLPALGQKSKAQLEREKQENLRKIREASNILKETQSKKDASIAQLTVLQKEIEARNELIESITQEVDLLNIEIAEINDIIRALKGDIETLKQEYAKMIYEASKTQSNYDKLTFIFSAESFNQLIMRFKYLQQFSDARKYQVEQIEKVKLTLDVEKNRLASTLQEKNELLNSKKIEQENLNRLRLQQDDMIAALNDREKQLKKEVNTRRKENKKLEKLIEDIVKREIARARKEAERKAKERAKTEKNTGISSTPEVVKLSNTFEANAKKLPWPVARGEIVGHFGVQPHPVLKGVTVENLGIDIITLKEEPVRSVFKGKVVTIASVPGMNNVVMVQHGEYFTVYAKLKTVTVKRGQEIDAKTHIGTVYTDKDGQSQLQFQIWKNNKKLDPEQWLYKK